MNKRQTYKQPFFMHFLVILVILLIFPTVSQARSVQCNAPTAPRLNVIPKTKNVKYDFTKNKAWLNNVDVDTISPYGPQHKTTVSGLMSGAIQTRSKVEFIHEKYAQTGQGCLYIKDVTVEIEIDPTIYVASEYKKGSCYHNAVLNHERKHVRVDQLVVNKYASRVGRALQDLIEDKTGGFGPYDLSHLPTIQRNIQETITKLVTHYNEEMNQERRRRQQAIDTKEEYDSIGARCPRERG